MHNNVLKENKHMSYVTYCQWKLHQRRRSKTIQQATSRSTSSTLIQATLQWNISQHNHHLRCTYPPAPGMSTVLLLFLSSKSIYTCITYHATTALKTTGNIWETLMPRIQYIKRFSANMNIISWCLNKFVKKTCLYACQNLSFHDSFVKIR